jgi:hypothetical protein
VQRDVKFDHDLESTSLEIKTNSALGSNDKVKVNFFTAGKEGAGAFELKFETPVKYYLDFCISSYETLSSLTHITACTIWKITLTRKPEVILAIHCDEKRVLNTVISSKTCSHGSWSKWTRRVEKIRFSSQDTASDYYRAGE